MNSFQPETSLYRREVKITTTCFISLVWNEEGSSSFSVCIVMLECWVDLRHKELVECFCGSCCPEVQLLLKAQTGFDASFLVGWMGNVGCEKEPSILHWTAWPSTHALHQNNQAFACQPGWEGEEWPGMWLVSEFQRTQMRIWERMPNSRGGERKMLQLLW